MPIRTDRLQHQYRLIRDCLEGEDAIRDQGQLYVPAPDGMSATNYRHYLDRGCWYGAPQATLRALTGIALRKAPVGRAFCDILNGKSVLHTRVTMTSGESENEIKERGMTFNTVGKNRLLSALNSAIHTGDLTIGNFPARDMLREELESFEASVGTTGRVRIEGGTAFGHGDLVVSAALALYLSDHRTIGAHIGVTPLKGYW